MVCFDSKKRALLDDAREKGTSIGLKKCKVKENRGEYEIIASTAIRIDVTDKEYIVDESLKADRPLALGSIDQMKDMVVNQRVTLKVKIIQVEVAVNINTNDGRMVRKQECVCADSSGSSWLVLWEIYIGKVEVGHCYELQDVTIRSFEEQKYLSTSSKCVIQDCDDIGEVSEDIEESRVFDICAEIVAVKNLATSKSCIVCTSGRVSTISSNLGKCLKCQSIMKLDKCKMEVNDATIVLEDVNSAEKYNVKASCEILFKIAKVNSFDNLEEKLLSADQAKYTIDNKDVIRVD